MNELIAAFHEYFKLVLADSPLLLEEVFRLRYQIFCEELGWFQPSLFPEQMEGDEYDRRSTHILLQHRPSGYYVGTARLVLADPSDLGKPFPIEESAPFSPGFAGLPRRLRRHVAEISRFGVLSRFPHHEGRRTPRYHAQATAGEAHGKSRLRFPYPTLALSVGIVRTSVENNITHWYAIMTPSFNRSLSHFGLNLQVVSPLYELYGQRRAHYASMADVLDRARCQHPEVWELITDCGRLCPVSSGPENDSSRTAARDQR